MPGPPSMQAGGHPSLLPSRRQWLRLLALLVLVIVVTVISAVLLRRISPARPLLVTGTRAPDITLDAAGGGHVDALARADGHLLVVEFIGATCPSCQHEVATMCHLAASHPQVTVVAVDAELDSAAALQRYRHDQGGGCTAYPLLLDPGVRTSHAFAVAAVPTVYVIGADRRIAYGGVGAPAIDGLAAVLDRLAPPP